MKTYFTYFFVFLMVFFVEKTFAQQDNGGSFHVKAQFAGDIGLFSLGVGKEFFDGKLDTDIFTAYLPESVGGHKIITSALKAAYVPFNPISLGPLDWRPLRTGLQLSYTFGDNFFTTQPESQYPKKYYKFSTAWHLYYFLGGEFDFAGVRGLERLGFYYEAATLGEYVVAYAVNPEYLSPWKIFHLGLGLRYSF